ncbi:MAG: rod shape-determining protein MreD [Planctomycetes bacterium]|nr:rod shape-determining protein MreD [Planctomycetota bacterium]
MKHPHPVLLLVMMYAAAVAQLALRDDLALGGARPDFLWAVIAFVAFAAEGPRAVFWASAGGLLADCLSPGPLGPAMIVAAIGAWIVQRSRARRPAEEVSSAWIGRSLFIVGTMMTWTWIRWETTESSDALIVVCFHVFGDALYTVLFGLAVSLLTYPVRRLRASGTLAAETPQTLTNQWKMLTP